jgi:hypothetical protein
MRWMSYWETRLCPANDHCLPGWPETGFEDVRPHQFQRNHTFPSDSWPVEVSTFRRECPSLKQITSRVKVIAELGQKLILRI